MTDQELTTRAEEYAEAITVNDDGAEDRFVAVREAWLAGYEAGVLAPRLRAGKKAPRVVEVRDPNRFKYYTNEIATYGTGGRLHPQLAHAI